MFTFVSLLRKRPHFRRLWLSEVVSLLGDWMSFVAISLLALNKGGSVVSLAWVLVAHSLPHALLAPIAGTLADRLDRRRLLIGANIVECGLTVAMALAAMDGRVGLVQVLVFVRASVSAFLPPVQSAALRRVVEADELLPANALASMTWSIMFAVGMAAGGAIATLGPAVALSLDAASFAVAALLLRPLPSMIVEGLPEKNGILDALSSVRRDMSAAWRHMVVRPPLLEAVIAKTPVALAAGGAWVLLNLVSNDVKVAGSAALALGIMQCVRGAGTGIGPLLSGWLLKRGLSIRHAGSLAAFMTFLGIGLFSLTQTWWMLLVTVFLWGMGGGSNWVVSCTELQRRSPDRFVGRLSAIDELAWTMGMCGMALAGAALVDKTGVHASSAWLGLGVGVVGWIALRWAVAIQSSSRGAEPMAEATESTRSP